MLRFNKAIRKTTKRKILLSTLSQIYCLHYLGYQSEIYQSFSIQDSYKLNIPNLYFSNSHSSDIHAISISTNEPIAIDTEYIIYKNKQIEEMFYKKHTSFYAETKDSFYKDWILYELAFKLCKHPHSILNNVFFIYFSNYIIGFTKSNNTSILIKKINTQDIIECLNIK